VSVTRRRYLGVSVGLLLLIAAGLVRQWPQRSLWYDETVNAYFARQSWSAIWEWCTKIDNQMPLDFALLKIWGSAVGTSEFALRAFSFINAVLAAAGVMALGRRVSGKASGGWLAALALALSQSFLYAAFEVRPYGLALALFAWSSVLLWDVWRCYADRAHALDRGYVLRLGGYILLALALIYAHYTGFLALAAHGVFVGGRTLVRRTRRRVVILAHLGVGIALGYLPWVVALAGRDVRGATAYDDRITPRAALKTYVTFYAYGQQLLPPDVPPYAWLAAVTIVIALAAAIWTARKNPEGAIFALALLSVPLLGLLAMVYGIQAKLSGRHGWPVWIGAALALGVGLAALDGWRWRRWPVWAAALLLVALPARVATRPIYDSRLREAFAYIDANSQPGDELILRDGTLFTAAGYYGTDLPTLGLPPDKITNVKRFLFFDEALDRLDTLARAHPLHRAWVVAWQGDIMDPQNLVAGIFEAVGDPVPILPGFGDVSVSLYALRQPPDMLRQRVAELGPPVQVPLGGPLYEGGYILNQGPMPRGGTVKIQTWWQRGAVVMSSFRVSLRLYDGDGNFHTQLDQPPVSPSFGQENWQPGSPILSRFTLIVPPDMPPGPAEVRLILYDMDGTFDPVTVVVGHLDITG
jgi:hypothetical protein